MKYFGEKNYEHGSKDKTGVLITNLGTPDAPNAKSLKIYSEFMKNMDNLNGWVCGLGHGINKVTPEKNVHLFIETIRKNFS